MAAYSLARRSDAQAVVSFVIQYILKKNLRGKMKVLLGTVYVYSMYPECRIQYNVSESAFRFCI